MISTISSLMAPSYSKLIAAYNRFEKHVLRYCYDRWSWLKQASVRSEKGCLQGSKTCLQATQYFRSKNITSQEWALEFWRYELFARLFQNMYQLYSYINVQKQNESPI